MNNDIDVKDEKMVKMMETTAQLQDVKSLLLLQNSAEILLLRQQMEENEKKSIMA